MAQFWKGLERRTRGASVNRRAHVRAAWACVRVESVDYADRGGAVIARVWVRLGALAPADVAVELVTPSRGGCRMWCEQSYHNGSFAYTASMARVADETEDTPETWTVRVTPARRWIGVHGLPPVVGGVARVTSGSGPARAPASHTRCGA
ncbi:hypothetical protein J421_5677 (plasmid) [Gemmatirosa kalamazoonensis]|uniref:Uncharacterized protein n=1 Tax=Gemmatirosa kalamazoonensis TaxID=861299 RepID=W0RRZ3_9BACT|nr:hypothetical protein J421_5677 [Gemmatirosa kalamazoonensis]